MFKTSSSEFLTVTFRIKSFHKVTEGDICSYIRLCLGCVLVLRVHPMVTEVELRLMKVASC